MGCFKSKKLYQEQGEEEQQFGPAATEMTDKSEKPPEEKLPLNDDTADSSGLD